jgi:predicted metal-dependent peptidase
MEATIVAAATAAKVCGKGNGLVERVLNSVTASNTDWRNELRAMMTSSARSDYSYRRFSKRFVSNGLYLPSLYSEELGGVLIGIDTSGSMGQRELDIIAADVQQIFDDLQPEYIEVVYCDSSINKVQRFERGDDIKLVVCGGGGTRFKPVFDHIHNMEHPPVGMIYFTDMYGDLKECDDPNIPMIWANLGGSRVEQPFGVMVNVQI